MRWSERIRKSEWGLLLGMKEMPALLERWHALWLLTQGWTAAAVAEALGRDAHTIGRWWAAAFAEGGPQNLSTISEIGLS